MAKSARIKVPKRIAGVKIPKAVRKGPFMDFVNSSAGRLLLAEAAMAATTLFAAKQVTGESTHDALAHPIDTIRNAGGEVKARATGGRDELTRNSARLQFALGEAVRAFRAALSDPQMMPDSSDEQARTADGEAGGGKKKIWSPSEPAAH